jgi:hypothetical protein
MESKPKWFLIIFGGFWSLMTLLFDGLIFVPVTRQLPATRFVTTEGTVLSSKVTNHEDAEGGTTYGVAVQYAYSVNDREYTGRRYR